MDVQKASSLAGTLRKYGVVRLADRGGPTIHAQIRTEEQINRDYGMAFEIEKSALPSEILEVLAELAGNLSDSSKQESEGFSAYIIDG